MSEQDHDLLIRVHESVQTLNATITSRFADHEGRLRLLEKDVDNSKGAISLMKGLIALLSAIAAVFGALWWIRG